MKTLADKFIDRLNNESISIISAENPRLGEIGRCVTLDKELNEYRTEELRTVLILLDIEYKQVKGFYGGEENAFIIYGQTTEKAEELAAAYFQDSIVTNEALIYRGGGKIKTIGLFKRADDAKDFYSVATLDDGTEVKFQIDIDF